MIALNTIIHLKRKKVMHKKNICNQVCSLTGEGNSNPLQYSCLENSMDGEAW